MAYFRLVRFPNLLIVALTQGALYFRILLPALQAQGIAPQLDATHFTLYLLITVIVTAGGYIINDILDYPVDLINKPQRVLINQQIPVATAAWLYAVLGLVGFVLTVYLAFYADRVHLIGVYPAATALLYLYSSYFKKRPLSGNLLIAAFCAAVAGLIWLAEWASLLELANQNAVLAYRIQLLFTWYMVFAFLGTLFRELIKDLQDARGDQIANWQTAPIRWGSTATKAIALLAGLLLLAFVIYQFSIFRHYFSIMVLLLLIIGIILPLLYSFYRLILASTPEEYHQLSTLAKVIMFNGILLLFFANIS